MKKKALITALTSIALTGALCVGFASCDKGGDDARDLEGETITKEVWDAAIREDAFENFKLEYDASYISEKTQGESTVTTTQSAKAAYVYAEKKTYAKGTNEIKYSGVPEGEQEDYQDESEEIEYYLDESGSGEYGKCIVRVDGIWTDLELNSENYSNYVSAKSAVDFFINEQLPSKNFEDYEYSETHKGYVAKQTEEGKLIVVKFKNGKLRALYVEEKDEETYGEEEEQYTRKRTETGNYLFTFGGQSVMLPVVV